MLELPEPLHFQWDQGNEVKNWHSHQVSREEIEQIFFDPRKQHYPDPIHSLREDRKILVGKTKTGRVLLVVYTVRGKTIRVISARDLNKKREGDLYEKTA
jgi:uncharacterized DUF497 family protein